MTIDPTKFDLLESVKIYLRGDDSGAKSQIETYIDANLDKFNNANMRLITNVSSWALVVDVTWKKDFAPVRKQGTLPTDNVLPTVG